MTIAPELERELVEAVRRHASSPVAQPDTRWRRLREHRVRPSIAAGIVVGVLALSGVALAAVGVIPTGSPVAPEELLNPKAGEGIPAPGASRLLSLRVPDPEGGPPWGMRIVHTTRGEVCLQIGRVQDGKLGELGIDGAFHDDGRFHPLPADALPRDVYHGHVVTDGVGYAANSNTSCQLAGWASASEHLRIESSAAASIRASRSPRSDLRNIYYGILGKHAVSVGYRAGGREHTEAVLPGTGAYLIVARSAPGQQVGSERAYFASQLTGEGQLQPGRPLTVITYRIDGKLCQSGLSEPPGTKNHLAHPCPQPPHVRAVRPMRVRDLHLPVHVHLQVSDDLVTGAQVSFTAPFAVTGAGQSYEIATPKAAVHGTVGRGRGVGATPVCEAKLVWMFQGEPLAHDVMRGSTVSQRLSAVEVFEVEHSYKSCGHHFYVSGRHSATIKVLFERTGEAPVVVGSTAVTEPPGTRTAPPPTHRHAAADSRRRR